MKVNTKVDVDALEIVLDSGFFGFAKDLKILFTYASPINSSYTISRDQPILEKIETHIDDGRNSFFVYGRPKWKNENRGRLCKGQC